MKHLFTPRNIFFALLAYSFSKEGFTKDPIDDLNLSSFSSNEQEVIKTTLKTLRNEKDEAKTKEAEKSLRLLLKTQSKTDEQIENYIKAFYLFIGKGNKNINKEEIAKINEAISPNKIEPFLQ